MFILIKVEEVQVVMIVMGLCGFGIIRWIILGSVSEYVFYYLYVLVMICKIKF